MRCETKTKDNVFVTVIVSVQYQASRAVGRVDVVILSRSVKCQVFI